MSREPTITCEHGLIYQITFECDTSEYDMSITKITINRARLN